MLALDVVGVHLVRFQTDMAQWLSAQRKSGAARGIRPDEIALSAVFWIALVWAAIAFDFWADVLTFWVVPLVFVLYPLIKLHGYGEHTGATGPTEYERTWVHDFSGITNFFIYPIKSGYHLEHHLFPMVPWYNMDRFRRALLAVDEFRQGAELVTADGYFFGRRTIFGTMICGDGEYRTTELDGVTAEQDEIVAGDLATELDEQIR